MATRAREAGVELLPCEAEVEEIPTAVVAEEEYNSPTDVLLGQKTASWDGWRCIQRWLILLLVIATLGSLGTVLSLSVATSYSPHFATQLGRPSIEASQATAPATTEPLGRAAQSPRLSERCTASLTALHAALTAWFSGGVPESWFDEFIEILSLSADVSLVPDRGAPALDYAQLVGTLRTLYATEAAGSAHSVDTIRVVHEGAQLVNLTYRETQQVRAIDGGGAAASPVSTCIVVTAATCVRDEASKWGVAWRSFTENKLPCTESREDVDSTSAAAGQSGRSGSLYVRLSNGLSAASHLVCDDNVSALDKAAATWNFRVQRSRRPKAIVSPATPSDVAQTLRVAREMRLRVSVRNGGHSPLGLGLAPGGITIDMSRRAGVVVRQEASLHAGEPAAWVAEVESGAVWADVYRALDGKGLHAVGGGCAGVGVVGILTAGGVAVSSRAHGLASDGVLQYTVILPNGTLVEWQKATHGQLHRAMTASRVALGVVWRVKLRLWPIGATGLFFGSVNVAFHFETEPLKGQGPPEQSASAEPARETNQSVRDIAMAHDANLRATKGDRRWSLTLEQTFDGCMLTFFYAGTPDEARVSGRALGLFDRLWNATKSASRVEIPDDKGNYRRSLLSSRTAPFRRLESAQEVRERILSGNFQLTSNMLSFAAAHNSSQAIVRWHSAAIDEMSASDWERVMLMALPTQAGPNALPFQVKCGLQAEHLGGAIDESPAWPHAPAAHLLSFICFSDGVDAEGRPWLLAGTKQVEMDVLTSPAVSAWLAGMRQAAGRVRGGYAGYASEEDSAAYLIGADGVVKVQQAQTSVDGAVELFGDVTKGWRIPSDAIDSTPKLEASLLESQPSPPLSAPEHKEDKVPPQPQLAGPVDLVTGGTSGIGLAVVEQLVASGRRVLVASHDAPRCANVMARVHVGGMVTCLIADLASTDGAASLARAVATVMGDYACLRTVMLAASPGAVEYDPLLDTPLARIARVHFMAHRELLRLLVLPAASTAEVPALRDLWCDEGETRVVVVGSGASEVATRTGVRALLTGAPYWNVPPHPPPSGVDAATGIDAAILSFFENGGSGQAYASAKMLEELMVLELRRSLSEARGSCSASRPASQAVTAPFPSLSPPQPSLHHVPANSSTSYTGLPCPTIIVEAYPAGTVITPTSAPFAVWSNIPTISAAEGAAPVAQVILDDEYAHAVALEQERGQPKVPPWAMDLFNHSEGSLDRFLEEV